MNIFLKAILLISFLVSFTDQVLAGPFQDLKNQGPLCFEKSYSSPHLASHPKQTVKRMQNKFYVSPEWDGINLEIKADILRPQRNAASIVKPYKTSMSCRISTEDNNKELLKCGIDCDGGTADISYNVLSSVQNIDEIKFVNNGFVMYGGCGDEVDENDAIWLKPIKNGDDVFVLKRVTCK